MSKILKSFGMAALLVALLAGTGMADDTAGVTVSGTVEDMTLTISTEPGAAAFGNIIKGTGDATINQDDGIGITTNVGWKLALTDDNSKAFKMQGVTGESTEGEELTNAYVVTLDPTGTPVVLTTTDATGTSTSGSETTFDLRYLQSLDASDVAGPYTSDITYTLSYNA